MPKNSSLNHILIIGSGPIVIGQACEFDYSGSQASRSLRDEGIEVTLINSNPATIMTDPVVADNIYLKPLTVESIEEILEKHPEIDAVLPTMGGQTALNLCIDAEDNGVWTKYDVDIIGVNIDAINITEDREQFRNLMQTIDIPMAPQRIAKSFLEGKEAAQEFGFPLCIRASFTLGGTGATIVYEKEDFEKALTHGLHTSPIHEVIIDKALLGWKEYELELLRDKNNNIIIICSIENMDPMGVHTGDSITVAPAMTLSDTAYQRMRDMAIKMMGCIGDFAGGCNVQFAVSPDEKEDIVAIEINPRVSRSSALASKATGYPIAKIASKLAIGYSLDELYNQITKTSSAYFEPTLDYVIVKFPRWNFDKFDGCDSTLGLQMKSVGEVMAIGRSFQEALQKACQSLEISRNGLGADAKYWTNQDQILNRLKSPSWDRVFRIYDAMRIGIPKKTIYEMTGIDHWFLSQMEELIVLEHEMEKYSIYELPRELLLEAKMKGYADRQIAHLTRCWESEVHKKRLDQGINRVYKLVDTCAAEFEAQTPYYYSTFENEIEINGKRFTENEVEVSDRKKVIVLGSGPNRIGQGIEFDYCCVHGVLAAKELDKYGVKIIGTSFKALDLAEDRGRFSELLADNNIPYPEFGVVESAEEALDLAKELNFPILVRPSYVLGGQGMKIVINQADLEHHVVNLLKGLPGNRILLDHYLDQAIEAEVDAISDGEDVYIIGMMEHIEPCGIHSGDSNSVLPPFDLSDDVKEQMIEITRKIAIATKTVGLINIQFAVKNETAFVIEANPRASRTVPFIAKAYQEPYVNYATKVMLGAKLKDFMFNPVQKGHAIKVPVFSFNKFPNVNKELGPEMKSTGESIYFIDDLQDPFFKKVYGERNLFLSK